MKKLFLLIFLGLCFYSCSSTLRYSGARDQSGQANVDAVDELRKENIDPDNFKPLEIQYGVASYYADKYNGRTTTSGEVYDMYGISAAHISYPMGTIVKVTNLNNNLSLILKINDRMPDTHNRVIDLSYGAAQKLDMIKSGIAKVKIEVISWGKNDSSG